MAVAQRQVEQAILDQLAKLLESSSFHFRGSDEIPTEQPQSQEAGDCGDVDITEKLMTCTPCVMCRQICEEAASEIETLRMLAADRPPGGEGCGDILVSLNAAITGCDPCGREDCVSPSVSFLTALRDELWRLRRREIAAKKLVSAAKKVWRNEAGSQLLIHAVVAYEKE